MQVKRFVVGVIEVQRSKNFKSLKLLAHRQLKACGPRLDLTSIQMKTMNSWVVKPL
jgi:hypothetical protein